MWQGLDSLSIMTHIINTIQTLVVYFSINFSYLFRPVFEANSSRPKNSSELEFPAAYVWFARNSVHVRTLLHAAISSLSSSTMPRSSICCTPFILCKTLFAFFTALSRKEARSQWQPPSFAFVVITPILAIFGMLSSSSSSSSCSNLYGAPDK